MKKCNECNCDMIDNCSIKGKHPFEVDVKERVDISIHIPTGEKRSFFGIPYDVSNQYEVKARICPKCGKIELYAQLNNDQETT